ncbi:hypothetical protein [Geothrix sp. PMB-07]|uniref:hypothetical protein n=1 Tax=Geothrix sp. PMB-07 TaxID=3068640 RepID=UPI002741A806|nr:hypothetical protein [Geothrix sp. PMB-07]WLT32115.1 hypothetical protein Q9293_02055 [Geothrix sp. PMB-07]
MRNGRIRSTLLTVLIGCSAMVLNAQAWDAASQARGWAKQDKDDSFTFFDPGTRSLLTWMREGGLLGSVPLGKLEDSPDRWVLDPRNSAWVAHGTTLSQIDRTGRITTNFKLPAEAGDICWDAKGFTISYRTREPYLEKRDYKGAVIWAFGAKPSREDAAPQYRRTLVVDDSGNLLMADGNSLNLSILDGNTGRKLTETTLRLANGQPAPALEGVATDRGPLAIWPGKGVIFVAVKASQLPAAQRADLQGLVLARIEFAQSRLEFLPTGLDEGHLLVGLLDTDAIFSSPKGGLLLVRIK